MNPVATSPCPPPDFPAYVSWGIPVVFVSLYTFLYGSIALWIFRRNFKRFIIEGFFLANLSMEAGVSMRVQFSHTAKETRINCIITTVSAGLALFCMLWDNYEKYKTPLPLRRILYLYRHLTRADICRLCLQLLQLLFRLLETLARYKLRTHFPKIIIESDFSVIPLVLAMTIWTTRLLDNKQRPVDSINFVIIGGDGFDEAQGGQPQGAVGANVGNGGQQANPIPSPLLGGILGINHIPVFNLKCFDHWSTIVNTNKGRKTLNMWQLREIATAVETNWKLPHVDFIVLYFSLINRASYHSVTNKWVPFLKLRARNVRIILVGTDQHRRDELRVNNPTNQPIVTSREVKRLALRAKAVAYEQCDCGNRDHQLRLVNQLVELVV